MNTQQAEAIKTLTEAKRLVSRHWVQESEEEPHYRGGRLSYTAYCAWGAIKKADGPGENTAKAFLINAIRSLTGRAPLKRITEASLVNIFDYNDAEERKKKEVIAAFDKAIEMVNVDEEVAPA